MRKRLWQRTAIGFFVVLLILLSWAVARADGPWRAEIVDKETGKALEGVVVLAVWRKCGFIVMDGCADYYDSQEVVTGADGRFIIEARRRLLPLPALKGPEFYILKPGYGQWQFKGQDTWSKDAFETEKQRKAAWRKFEGDGIVIELAPLKSRQERDRFYVSASFPSPPGDVPPEKKKRFREAEIAERTYLGLNAK
jgi:hypothetical protein